MQFVFSDQPAPVSVTKSIFLEGPSPRKFSVADWRHEAVEMLKEANYDGHVYIPCPKATWEKQPNAKWEYDAQVQWEVKMRNAADVILCWVPRDLTDMPALTTNVEFGEDFDSNKIVYGRPDSAPKCRYLDSRAIEVGVPVYNSLQDCIKASLEIVGAGAFRQNAEVLVPIQIWNNPVFQSWYVSQRKQNNELRDAKVLWSMKIKGSIFAFLVWVDVFIAAENRRKTNEFVFFRKDISCVVPIYTEVSTGKTYVVLVQEFRSPVRNDVGLVQELPGGGSFKPNVDPQENARDELFEETGLSIEDYTRFKYVASKQLCSTLSAHQAHVYAVDLTDKEFDYFKRMQQQNSVFGIEEDSERTKVLICEKENLVESGLDFSMLGMIWAYLLKK